MNLVFAKIRKNLIWNNKAISTFQGLVKIELPDGGVRYCNYHNGIRHGLSRDIARSALDGKHSIERIEFFENDQGTILQIIYECNLQALKN